MSSKDRQGYFTKLSVTLFIASIVLLINCRYNIVSSFSKNDVLGLAEKLQIGYWFGLASIMASLLLLIFSNIKRSEHEKLFLLEVFVFALYLYAIPALVESNLYYPDTWGHLRGSMAILTYKSYNQPLHWYAREFPGVYILQSVALLITGIEPVTLAKYYPILFSLLAVLTSYILLRRLLSDTRTVYLATIFLVSGSVWVFPKHFCPNSFALIWYLLIFYFAFSPKTIKTMGLSIFLGILIIVSHPTTVPFLIISMLSIQIGFALFRSFKILEKQHSSQKYLIFSHTFVLFLFVSWLAWLAISAPDTLTRLALTARRFFASLPQYLTWARATERLSMTSSYLHFGQTLKTSYSVLYVLTSAIGVFYLFFKRYKKNKIENDRNLAAICWIAACFVLGLATAFLQGGEFLERSLLYGFVPLSVLAVINLKNRYGKVILISAILIGAPLSIFATYTNEYFEYSPISDSYGAMFMADHNITDMRSVIAIDPTIAVIRFHLSWRYFEHDIHPNDLLPTRNTIFVWSETSERFYFIYLKGRLYTQIELQSHVFWMENYFNMTSQPGFNLVYNSKDFQLLFVAESVNNLNETTGG
ncbi:MAG: hypothetical protein OEW62_00995 [Candidatus Bathyarchaeota archaeon]|nr:hypothetical protein [Candidatus Bathyarchaeota archaeon]MDH5595109.1 hypothetical protein [Candidatus Bathyarchaeota archaeon]